ncbi:MAG: GvpL/GvpF family gas vesicle protein [Chloroflexi bacterium]|nr:GvpL/GvpF family gas vesicle protein [Chloroflexota bacterium]
MGTYLYAILPAAGSRPDLGHLGLPDGGTPVVLLPGSGLAAVVSEYRGPAFGTLPRDQLLRLLALHQRVIERTMDARTVLPVKFGTVLASADQARAALDHWQRPLATALEELGNTVEIEVAASWDLKQTFAEIGRQPEIAALAAQAAGQPPEASLATRVQVGKQVKAALDQRRAAYRARVVAELAPWATDLQPNPLPSDELVLNLAFLVERARRDGFYAQVHRLDAAFAGQLTFRCIGPLPPYSFATVELVPPCPEEIDAARRLLGLGDWASEAEANASYRRLAARAHPDRHPNDPTATERFAALAAAHTRVLAYLHGQRGDAGQGDERRRYDLRCPAVAALPLLVLKRSQPEFPAGVEASYERDPTAV